MKSSGAAKPNSATQPPLWAQAAHDLRQPVQSLLLLTQVMSNTSDAAQRRQIASSMEDALVAFQSMLDGLAWLARLDAGVEAPRFGSCELSDICSYAAAGLDDVITGHGVRLRVTAAPVTVTSDPKMLETVIRGLLVNALKYGTGNEILLSYRAGDDGHRVEIAFKGATIQAAQKNAIFIEIQRRSGTAVVSEPAAGIGFLTRLSGVLGGTLECSTLPGGRQRLTLLVPSGDRARGSR